MINKRFRDGYGNVEKIDSRGNHFINGMCVNPIAHVGGNIGDTFDPTGLTETTLVQELKITGSVKEFSYFDHDLRETVSVVVQ